MGITIRTNPLGESSAAGRPPAWPEQTYLVDHRLRHVYCPIPKAVCTNLKKAFVEASGIAKAHGHFSFNQCPVHGDVHTCASREHGMRSANDQSCLGDPNYFVFAFVRSPWSRLVSAYLDKIGRQEQPPLGHAKETILFVQQQHGRAPDLDHRISFREFLWSTTVLADHQIDEHWRPQTAFLGQNRFDFIGRFEQAAADFFALEERTGLRVPDDVRNTVGWSQASASAGAPGGFVDQLDSIALAEVREHEGGFPDYRRFYPADLRDLVGQRYSGDVHDLGYEFDAEQE